MNRAYLIVLIPAALVGIGYVFAFKYFGIPVKLFPLAMAVVGFVAAIGLVRRYQHRKRRARSG